MVGTPVYKLTGMSPYLPNDAAFGAGMTTSWMVLLVGCAHEMVQKTTRITIVTTKHLLFITQDYYTVDVDGVLRVQNLNLANVLLCIGTNMYKVGSCYPLATIHQQLGAGTTGLQFARIGDVAQ